MMGVHLAESHPAMGTVSAHKNVYLVYDGSAAGFMILLSLSHITSQKPPFTFLFQNARKRIKGSGSGDPTFTKAHEAQRENQNGKFL